MKKLNKVILLIGMIIIINLTLTGCEVKLNTKNNVKNIDKKEIEGYTTYTHSSGVVFEYPEDWKDLGNLSKPVFVDEENGTSVNLLSEKISGVYNLKSYMNASIEKIKSELGEQIEGEINQEDVKLNGRDAAVVDYTIVQDEIKVNIKQTCFIDGDTVYMLTVANAQDNNSEVIDNIISSFRK